MGARNPALLLLVVALLAPAYEELLFRRVLFGRLWAAGRPLLGIVLSSAAFACMHELPGTGGNGLLAGALLWTCYAMMGALFAWVYRRTGTLWAAIGAHAVNNLIACRSEEHTSELQSLMRISYAVFCLEKKTQTTP